MRRLLFWRCAIGAHENCSGQMVDASGRFCECNCDCHKPLEVIDTEE